MELGTFTRAKVILSEIDKLKDNLKWIKEVRNDHSNLDQVKKLADYSYTLVCNEIERLQQVFKEL